MKQLREPIMSDVNVNTDIKESKGISKRYLRVTSYGWPTNKVKYSKNSKQMINL